MRLSLTKIGVILGLFIYVGTLGYFSVLRHNAFWSSYDLANMDQTVWQTSRGKIFELTGEQGIESRFGHHADLILALIAPLYWLWSDPRALLWLQSLALGVGGVLVFLIGKKILNNSWLALGVSVLYWINPGLWWTNIYDFHAIALAVPLILGAVWFKLIDKWKLAFGLSLLALLTKENTGLWLAVWWGLEWLKTKKLKDLAVGMICGLWAVTMVFGVMPRFSRSEAGGHWAWEWYLADNIVSEIKANDNLDYLTNLILPFGGLPLFSPIALAPALPDLGLNIISSQGQMKSVNFHYDVLINIAVVLAVISTLAKINKFPWLRKGWLVLALVVALRQNYFYSPLPSTPGHWRAMYQINEAEIKLEKYLKTIPPNAITTASSELRPHVNHRELSFNLPNGIERADYVIMSLRNRLIGDVEYKGFETDLDNRLSADENYRLEFSEADFRVYKKLKNKFL